MTQAIISTLGVPCIAGTDVTVAELLADLSKGRTLIEIEDCRRGLPVDKITDTLDELAERYSQPPGPSIEAAAREIARTSYKFWRKVVDGESAVPEIRDILTRHFGQASRAERAWEIWQERRTEWEVNVIGQYWDTWVVHQYNYEDEDPELINEIARADDPITAILRAAGEEGKDDV